MTFKSFVLGGAAAVALTCAGITAGIAQQTSAPPAQDNQTMPSQSAAPDATQSAAPDATGNQSDATTTTKHHRHAHHMARMSKTEARENSQEAIETQKLNEQQLANSQNGQASYGGQQSPGTQATGSDMNQNNGNAAQHGQNMTTAPAGSNPDQGMQNSNPPSTAQPAPTPQPTPQPAPSTPQR